MVRVSLEPPELDTRKWCAKSPKVDVSSEEDCMELEPAAEFMGWLALISINVARI